MLELHDTHQNGAIECLARLGRVVIQLSELRPDPA